MGKGFLRIEVHSRSSRLASINYDQAESRANKAIYKICNV